MNSLTNFFRTALDTVFPEAFETLGEQERRNLDRIKQKLTENLKSNPSTYLSFDSVDNPIGFITTMLGEDALQDLRPFPESDKLREIVEAFLIESLTTKELLIDVANYRGTKFDSLFNKIITIKNLTGAHFEAAITELESASGNISAYRSRFEKNISQRADLASFYAEYQKAAAPRKEAARELIQLITGENKDLEKIANIFKNGNLTGRVLES